MKATISGFRELWEVDQLSSEHLDVSFFRVNIRCLDICEAPEFLNIMVEDRHFRIPIEIESWEEARPILLSEGFDHHLGLVSTESQEAFLRTSGSRSVPAADLQSGHLAPRLHTPSDPRQDASGVSDGLVGFRVVQSEFPCLPTLSMPVPLTPAVPCSLPNSELVRGCTTPLRAEGDSLVKTPSFTLTTTGCQPNLQQPLGAEDRILRKPSLLNAAGSDPSSRLSSGHLLGRPALVLDKSKKALSLAANMELSSHGKHLAHRRSSRLAAKTKGVKKSPLMRAQDLMCKKLKMVRFASRTARSTSASSSAPPRDYDGNPGLEEITSPKTDICNPLTTEEVHLIKVACGIAD